MSSRKRKGGILVRPQLPLGFYSSQHFARPDARIIVYDDLIYSAARFSPTQLDGYYPERPWLAPEEIRLYAALALAVPEGMGKVYQYPYPTALVTDDSGQDLSDDSAAEGLRSDLLEWMNGQNQEFWLTVSPPPALGGPPYQVNENAEDVSKQEEVFDSIDTGDHLVVRGLGALLKGELLNRHHLFHVEACMSLYVAMEASLHIILRRLGETIQNPSNRDASRYLGEVFESRYVPERYFESYYEDRIAAIHPSSRRGVFPDAPLAADDYFDLYDQLCSLYDFLLTGTVREQYKG